MKLRPFKKSPFFRVNLPYSRKYIVLPYKILPGPYFQNVFVALASPRSSQSSFFGEIGSQAGFDLFVKRDAAHDF